jgi:hypothetical protein
MNKCVTLQQQQQQQLMIDELENCYYSVGFNSIQFNSIRFTLFG